MQPNKPYKFLQEEILEGVWPLSKFRYPIDIYLLIVLYVVWGFALFLIYPIPTHYIIAGSISAIGISVWTFGIVIYASTLRNIELDEFQTSMVSKKIYLDFMEKLFHNSSLFYGVAIEMVVYMLMINSDIIKDDIVLNRFFGNIPFLIKLTDRTALIPGLKQSLGVTSVPVPILLYIFFISFDICYRVGLSFHILVTQLRRNWSICCELRNKDLRPQIRKEDLEKIRKTDKYLFIALSGGIFLFPITFIDILLFLSLVGVVLFVFIATIFNIVSLQFVIKRYFKEEESKS